ncbi:MAG: hypothetical protein KF746_01375 [Chitinophagaceae bacterium]|nr:hypothetical protein [Chitinophagaceae bacterium]
MSLTTRRMLKEIKETTAKAEADLKQQTGLDIGLTVDETSFPEDEAVLNDFHVHRIYGIDSILGAMTTVTSDELGKEAVKEAIQKIVLTNTAKSWKEDGGRSLRLKDGVLTVSCSFSESSNNLYKPEVLSKEISNLL